MLNLILFSYSKATFSSISVVLPDKKCLPGYQYDEKTVVIVENGCDGEDLVLSVEIIYL